MILEPRYEEHITEFYASLEFYDTYVTFQLGGELNWLTMPKFRVALGLWMPEQQTTYIYTTAVPDSIEDILVCWMHIS